MQGSTSFKVFTLKNEHLVTTCSFIAWLKHGEWGVTLSIQICVVALLCCSESNSSSPIYVKRDRFVVLRQLVQ